MPIYEYECKSCHHHFDAMQKFSDAPITKCPKCSENELVKLVSAAGFQLKGTGWYATDFKTKPAGNANKNESATSTESGSGTSTASTTKQGGDE